MIGFTDTLIFIIVSFLECCIQIGFIPTNSKHDEILKKSGIRIMLVDSRGETKYISEDSDKWKGFDNSDYEEPCMLDDNTVVRRVPYREGYGYWLEDITDMNRINEVLEEMHDKLKEERKLVELDNQLKERSIKLEQRTRIYDRISSQLKVYIEKIKTLRYEVAVSYGTKKFDLAKLICVIGTFIKRYSNLMLVGEKEGKILSSELGMSFAESLRYINNANIPGDFMGDYNGYISIDRACDLYEAFEVIIEGYYEMLAGVYMRMNADADGILCKLTIEYFGKSEEYVRLEKEIGRKLADKFGDGIAITHFQEDNAVYYRLYVKGMNLMEEGTL